MTKEELEIAKAACCVGTIWDEYEGKENFDHMVGLRVKHLIELVRNYHQPSLPSALDDAANNYGIDIRLGYPRVMDETDRYIYNAFKAGAEWMAGQGVKIGETEIYLEDDGGEPPYDGTSWLELTGTEYPIPKDKFKDGDKVDIILRKKQ